MKNTSTFWRIAAIGFTVINVAGLIYAAIVGEPRHAVLHVVLLGGGFLAWQFVPRTGASPAAAAGAPVNERVLDSLQESIDAIALNVERIGEDQRFQAKLVKERIDKSSVGP